MAQNCKQNRNLCDMAAWNLSVLVLSKCNQRNDYWDLSRILHTSIKQWQHIVGARQSFKCGLSIRNHSSPIGMHEVVVWTLLKPPSANLIEPADLIESVGSTLPSQVRSHNISEPLQLTKIQNAIIMLLLDMNILIYGAELEKLSREW